MVEVSKSNSEAKRLIQGNGVKINGETVTDIALNIKIEDGMVLKAGKKCVVKLIK
ncbi:MAG: tyrosyl-tRNA synthetase [bacterium ADurb.Bin363]|nr:MAG: tyrosyl-tRNA synthetase [bacterium ADurb.Bin363]